MHDRRILLLRGAQSGIWSFPKGHIEDIDRDSPLRTAVRETQEETGFICGLDYAILGNSTRYGKRPYWVAVMQTQKEPRLCPREHRDWRWVSPSQAAELHTNTDVRNWLARNA